MNTDELSNALLNAIGENDDSATVHSFLNTGYPPFNRILSGKYDGGLPVGRITEIAGPPSSGKTLVSTVAMAAAQAQGGISGFCDHERSFDKDQARRNGLDVDMPKFIYKKPRTFEDSLQVCIDVAKLVREKNMIDEGAPICWVFDSLASMVPQSVLMDKNGKERDYGDRSMHDNTALARATSAWFPVFAQHCEEYDISAIFLNQIRQKPGVIYGDNTTTPGGDSPKFYASIRVMLSASALKKGTEVVGQKVKVRTPKNKIIKPFQSTQYLFRFDDEGRGSIDVEGSLIDFLIEHSYLERKGAWVTFKGGKYHADALAKKIREEGRLNELVELLADHNYEVEIEDGEG